jgi:hypothetical protein
VTVVPRSAFSTTSSVYSPLPSDSQQEGGVETDAELADQVGILRRISGQLRQELAGAGAGDGADIGNHFIARHADAVIGNRHRARLRVEADADPQFAVAFQQRLVGQRLEAQLVAGIRGVGYQFAQENLLVAVQRVDHQLQQLFDLGLKTQRLFLGGLGHGGSGNVG